ncbi:YmfL family putative regulatory protein [Xenorhabdus sp. XENO-7]|uniref:YmfL family putative regulatory protein n=1 Tax=Xenorhabdus aichiensis TaxID=3025874 RepID=A0ABT5M882_9GAMM|nr:YmfL family putative regulatory protein [Xenorhabdus aichiensis]MDC9623889.1 YmfL family putative regulatory protein [Xenorhabdus aichiensis]
MKNWQIEKQPTWYSRVVKRMITKLNGGYKEAAEWLGVTENSVYNRLRDEGDQIFPIGFAEVIQSACGEPLLVEEMARRAGGVFVPSPVVEVDREDIAAKFNELVGKMGELAQRWNEFTADGVIDKQERAELNYIGERLQILTLEYLSLSYRYFCPPEKVDAPDMRSEASARQKHCVE